MGILRSLEQWWAERKGRQALEIRFMEFWVQHGERLIAALELKAAEPEPEALCYYCQQYRPLSQMETIGKYDYCLEHGEQRKTRLMEASHGH